MRKELCQVLATAAGAAPNPLVMSLSLSSYMLCPAKRVRLGVNALLSVLVWKYLIFPVYFDDFYS